jgi:hypothetical protein
MVSHLRYSTPEERPVYLLGDPERSVVTYFWTEASITKDRRLIMKSLNKFPISEFLRIIELIFSSLSF